MRSRHADVFNHDEDAPDYDHNVRNERDPIRAGYEAALDWVIDRAAIDPASVVLDLGSGTGNLSERIGACRELVCVDVSSKMTELARPKLAHLNVSFVQNDLLAYFEGDGPRFDAVVSTYAVHHLTEDEKQALFCEVWERLNPGGRAAFGDLMLASAAERDGFARRYRDQGLVGVANSFEEEFYWYLDSAIAGLERLGFAVESKRFSDLSWGVAARKPR